MNKVKKVMANTLLLIFVIGVVILPSVSSGMMRINRDDRVLSITDERPVTVEKKPVVKQPRPNVKTIIIKEIPEKQPLVEIRQTSESTASPEEF